MGKAGPSGISASGMPRKRRPEDDASAVTETSKSKRVKKAISGVRKRAASKGKQPKNGALTRRVADTRRSTTAGGRKTLEQIFHGMEADRLEKAVKREIELCLRNNDTLTKAVSHLNGNFKQFKAGDCDSGSLFDYIERQNLLEKDLYCQLIPLEVVIEKAELEPVLLD